MNLVNVIEEFPADLQTPVLRLATVIREEMGVSHEDFSELKEIVRDLADAQKRTENRVEELTETMRKGFKALNDTVAALRDRWGILDEATIRNILPGILGKTDYSFKRGYFGGRKVDIVIRSDNTHILLEVTSSLHPGDILKYVASADDYEAQTGVSPIIMVAAPHIRPKVIKAINASPRPIELYSDEDEDEAEEEL